MLVIVLGLMLYQPGETNPVKIVIGTGFDLYQKFISPAQADVCNFSPSCSHFSRFAIKRYGIIWGLLMALDRLMRCNPWAYKNYRLYYYDIKDGKLFDPIENNFIFGRISEPEEQEKILIEIWNHHH